MRTIIESLPAPEARVKYPPETEIAATYPEVYTGYFDGGVSFRDCPLDEASVFPLSKCRLWGSHMMCHIIKSGPTPEELAKLPLGQQVIALLDRSKEPKTEAGWTVEQTLREATGIGESLAVTNSIDSRVVYAMLSESSYRRQFLTTEEMQVITSAVARIHTYIHQRKAISPTQQLSDALVLYAEVGGL